jgi:D-alanyl-D-alanine carboxypeptidase
LVVGLVNYSSGQATKLKIYDDPVRSTSLNLPQLPAFPVQAEVSNPAISAKSYASLDRSSGVYLLGKDVTATHPPASTSKLLLAWVVRQKCPLDKVVTINSHNLVGTVIGLQSGEKWTLESLLYASLVASANDAATALAEGCFGSVNEAVKAMNERASAWHLTGSHFTNPTGLDEDRNYITSLDLARMTDLILADEVITKIVGLSSATIHSADGTISKKLVNTNKLLGQNGVDGVKTGSTESAGENLIVSAALAGHHIIAVVLGSTDRFSDMKTLLGEITRVYRWQVENDLYFGTILGESDSRE